MKRILTTFSQKWPEYLLEILVLIIGIYGAFAVDSWNETRKQQIEEIELLQSIKADLVKATEEIDALNSIRSRILEVTKELYLAIRNEKTFTDYELDSLFAAMKILPTFNSPTGTINALFNTGKIISITNDSIRAELLTWPQAVEDVIEEEIYANDYFVRDLVPMARKHIPFYEINKFFNLRNFASQRDMQGIKHEANSKFTHDYKSLFQDIEFEGTLSNRENMTYVGIIQSDALKDKAQRIIVLIDNEINR